MKLCLILLVVTVSTEEIQKQNSCIEGFPGMPGSPGHNGLPGRDGRDGTKGEKGDPGISLPNPLFRCNSDGCFTIQPAKGINSPLPKARMAN